MPAEKNKKISLEIIRFIITGIIATIIDFGVFSLVAVFIPDSFNFWKTFICTAGGFLVSLVVNYLLSAFWVYKNVDKSINKKSPKNLILFAVFSLVGLLLGTAIMCGFDALDNYVIHISYQDWLKFITNSEHYPFNFLQFFLAGVFFAVKTLIVLVWNYLSRKKFIFKSPEEVQKEKK